MSLNRIQVFLGLLPLFALVGWIIARKCAIRLKTKQCISFNRGIECIMTMDNPTAVGQSGCMIKTNGWTQNP